MNPDHLQILCSELDLGVPGEQVSRVYGGFHHKMWRLDTDRKSYAVKELGADANLNDPNTVKHYNVAEKIADTFTGYGVNAVAAINKGPHYLHVIDGIGYLVYPWSEAVALDRTEIDEEHGLKVARLMAAMHRANIDVPGAQETPFDAYPAEEIIELVHRASDCHVLCARELNEQLESFIQINEAHESAMELLCNHLLIGHGDLDQKNVLWDEMDNPIIIDWESARKLNPTYEIILAALDWAGITSSFDSGLFTKILDAYQEAGGVIEQDSLKAAFECILGDWLLWLLYVVAISLDEQDPEQREIEAEQIDFVLPTILRLQHLIPELLPMVAGDKEAIHV